MDHTASKHDSTFTDNTLAGGGEMGQLMRERDWSKTPVGSMSSWPQSLRTAVSICLASRFPIIIFWGPDLVQFYNDAYRPVLGTNKHPSALGQQAKDCWPEVWDVIGPMLHGVLSSGEATWSENQLLLLDRNGYVEECYFTFSYSPVRNETGNVGGVFCAVTETTGEVIAERRLRTLGDVAAHTAEITTAEEICRAASQVLNNNLDDLPFTLLYLLDNQGNTAHLAGTSGRPPSPLAHPEYIELDDPQQPWPFSSVSTSGQSELIDNLQARFGESGGDHETLSPPAHTALILPLLRPGQTTMPYGFLVSGLSQLRPFDESYQQVFSLLAGQIATTLANVRSYQEARERADALAELDRAKTIFFSNVSHEFRTPLTLLLGPIESLLTKSDALSPEQQESLEIARRNGLRLLKLVNTLLDFSRLEAGRTDAVFEPTDLATLTADLAGSFRSTIERAGLSLVVENAPLSEPVYVDHDMWEKIVLNLLSNAFKFTFEGQIRVTLTQENDRVTLTVQDTGTGIETDVLPHLFERFYRVRNAQSRTYEGTGIGLSLVQELVQLHGGTIHIQGQIGTEQHGTTVTVTIPTGTAHLPAHQIHVERTLPSTALGAAPFVEEALRWLQPALQTTEVVNTDDMLSPALSSSTLNKSTSSIAHILVVDDNADMRDYLLRLLQPFYTVETANNGVEALDKLYKTPPDLIITDIMMPVMDGIELLRNLRADIRSQTLPVILLSARAGEEATIEGLQVGANDYLVKPFSARELLATVKARLEIARVHEEVLSGEREQAQELRQLAEERTLLYQQAQEATQQRDELLAMVSHDLKNPLGAIKGYAQILRRTLASSPISTEERVQTSLERIVATTNKMTSLINELLDLSHIYRGQVMELMQESVDLIALLRTVVTEQQNSAQQSITVESSVKTLRVTGDSARLDRVFSNLISNAIKYNTQDKPIVVSLARTETENGPMAIVEVRDQGIGIPTSDLQHIFEPFHRASNVVGKIRGTGIGLASAYQIIERHGGSIEVQSTQGVGSTFTVCLPLAE